MFFYFSICFSGAQGIQYLGLLSCCTVIRYVSNSAKSGIFTVLGLNVEDKMRIHSRVNVNIIASTSAPFRPTTVQVPNLALT
jgi:hypothetical protein